jgi:hypothetical protein
MIKISYSGYRFPPEIIQHAIWLILADASRIGRGLGFGHQTRAFEIGGKNEIDLRQPGPPRPPPQSRR